MIHDLLVLERKWMTGDAFSLHVLLFYRCSDLTDNFRRVFGCREAPFSIVALLSLMTCTSSYFNTTERLPSLGRNLGSPLLNIFSWRARLRRVASYRFNTACDLPTILVRS